MHLHLKNFLKRLYNFYIFYNLNKIFWWPLEMLSWLNFLPVEEMIEIFLDSFINFSYNESYGNYLHYSVQNLEIIEPSHSSLWGTTNKKKSLFHLLKTTKTIGGYAGDPFVCLFYNFLAVLSFINYFKVLNVAYLLTNPFRINNKSFFFQIGCPLENDSLPLYSLCINHCRSIITLWTLLDWGNWI